MFDTIPRLKVHDRPQAVPELAAIGDILKSLDQRVSPAVRIDRLHELRKLRAAVAAAEAREQAGFHADMVAQALAEGVPARIAARGISDQIGLALGVSPATASRNLAIWRGLITDMPNTFGLLEIGEMSEAATWWLGRETHFLDSTTRTAIDHQLAGETEGGGRPVLSGLGWRQARARAAAAAIQHDQTAVVQRRTRAERDRCVTIRPAPDAMVYLTALLPMTQGIACYANLRQAADQARATGDDRGRGQLIADTLVERLTGQATATAVPVEVQIGVPADTLQRKSGMPGRVGSEPIPANLALELAFGIGADEDVPRTVRLLFADRRSGQLVTMESTARVFPKSAREYLAARDQRCRTPGCQAQIREADHIRPWARGGITTTDNGEGLCQHCNLIKEQPGWHHGVIATGPGGRHTTLITTHTGHTYQSTAPPILWAG